MGNDDAIKGSRLRRATKMTRAAAGVAGREGAARVLRSDRQRLKTAEALVKVFSGMRGAAMKIGQTLSAVDLGLVPEDIRPEFQAILAQLQEGAEPVSFRAVRGVIEDDLGARLGRLFADFDETPLAAASIGQVHRATLRDGRDVAVKVQYPGIAEAIHADLQNLRLALKLLSAIAPGIDSATIATEIRERITEELDYELEASNQRAMARVYRGHPFMVVPDVAGELCTERVIVSDYVDGARFASVLDAPQADRDRLGEVLIRFYVNGPLRHRLLNGDPHPGNALFLADGRVAFVDFGFFKRVSVTELDVQLDMLRAVYGRDEARLWEISVEQGIFPATAGPQASERLMELYRVLCGWFMEDTEVTISSEVATAAILEHSSLRGAGFDDITLPADQIVAARAYMLVLAILGQLKATNNWFRIGRETIFGDPPATELGRAEAAFLRGEGRARD